MIKFIIRAFVILLFSSLVVGPLITVASNELTKNDIDQAKMDNYFYTIVYQGLDSNRIKTPEQNLACDLHLIYFSPQPAESNQDLERAKKHLTDVPGSYPGLSSDYSTRFLAQTFASGWIVNQATETKINAMRQYGLQVTLVPVPEIPKDESYTTVALRWFVRFSIIFLLVASGLFILGLVIEPDEMIKDIKKEFRELRRHKSLAETQIDSLTLVREQLIEQKEKLKLNALPTGRINSAIGACEKSIAELRSLDADDAITNAEYVIENAKMLHKENKDE